MKKEQLLKLREDLELLINNIDPQSKIKIEQETILQSDYNKELLKNLSSLIKEHLNLLAKTEKSEQRKKQNFTLTLTEEKISLYLSRRFQ